MSRNAKTKVKLLYVLKILQEETDATHGLTMNEIISKLAEYGISAERKGIYRDFRNLREVGIDVVYHPGTHRYSIEHRGFQLTELMLMVDAIQSCRAITKEQSHMLITNIKQLASNDEQVLLDRRIHVEGRIKSLSESVLFIVDIIHEAIRTHHKIAFSYYRIGVDGERYEIHEGKRYEVDPIEVTYDDGFYYLTACNREGTDTIEYRLDRMGNVEVLEKESSVYEIDMARYHLNEDEAVMFGRFGGKRNKVEVILASVPSKIEIITDRFGKSITFLGMQGSEAHVRVKVYKSEQFFGWVASMGKVVRIVAPENIVQDYKNYLRYLLED